MGIVKPTIVSEEKIYVGKRFSVVKRTYAKNSGEVFTREIVLFPEAVVVLPFISINDIVLIKQFRPTINDYIIEAPAGVVDQGENPDETARRELVEEIGYYPRKLIKIASYIPTPGYSTEILHFYIAKELEYRGAKPEEYELIEPFIVDFETAYRMVLDNKIRDMKTSLAILLVKNMS
ncbi:MAG: NUDIX hydrolase [Desulfurococcaceae archaeon]